MRVQWNSGAVEQLRKRLRDAREGLEMCERQARGVRLCLEDANPDGENRTLRASLARFEECLRASAPSHRARGCLRRRPAARGRQL